jgi:hypothetical protein
MNKPDGLRECREIPRSYDSEDGMQSFGVGRDKALVAPGRPMVEQIGHIYGHDGTILSCLSAGHQCHVRCLLAYAPAFFVRLRLVYHSVPAPSPIIVKKTD